MTGSFQDALTPPGATGLPARFFDRFMFNLHPQGRAPWVIVGLGVYPAVDVIDGYAIAVTEREQRNLRFSTELSATDGTRAGPLSWRVVEPLRTWQLRLGPNPAGLELDVTWRARTPAWSGEVAVANAGGAASEFAHLFQSGRYEGTLRLDGVPKDVAGWYGQRDRSRGIRSLSGGQGLHLWVQAQFPDRCVGFLLAQGRQHEQVLLEGAVMHEAGGPDSVTAVRHDLAFNEGLDLVTGTVEVSTESGAVYRLVADASARGGFMAGGGYDGQHGHRRGRDHLEYDAYPLDGSVSPRTLGTSLTDRLTEFTWGGVRGYGIFEFALTRSRSYAYRPTLDRAGTLQQALGDDLSLDLVGATVDGRCQCPPHLRLHAVLTGITVAAHHLHRLQRRVLGDLGCPQLGDGAIPR
jgi:hypothetical protein